MRTRDGRRASAESLKLRKADRTIAAQQGHVSRLNRYLAFESHDALRHVDEVIDGHRMSVTEDELGVVELHEEDPS